MNSIGIVPMPIDVAMCPISNPMDPPIIQIPRTGSYNGLIECGGPATRAVVAVEERTSLVSLALPEEHCIARSNFVASLISLT